MSTPERKDITERLRLRAEEKVSVAPPLREMRRMKTSIFIDPEVIQALDVAFDTYNYENRDARVKKAAFMERVLLIGMQHSEDVAQACRQIERARRVRG